MYSFGYQLDSDNIVTVTMDMPGAVNKMDQTFEHAMTELIKKLKAETSAIGVIFTSAKSSFFAGGDLEELKEFGALPAQELKQRFDYNKGLLRELEKLPIPVVAAINGAALGGGWELCLACNYRVALNSAKFGLPEVTLGLLPGAGGIVRSIHLLGLEKAAPILLEGRQHSAEQGLQLGLIHGLAESQDELIQQARSLILENQGQPCMQPWDKKGYVLKAARMSLVQIMQQAMGGACMTYKKTQGLMPAPERILSTALETLSVSFDTALTVETEHFIALVQDPVSKNMITTFFFQLNQVNAGLSRPKDQPKTTVSKVGVIGAGMMGQGIAFSCAKVGIDVVLKDMSLEQAQKGKTYSEKLLDKAIQRGRSNEAKKQAHLAKILPTDKDSDLDGCDLIIEAVFEKVSLKHDIVKASESQLSQNGIWGSNTSTLPITTLASASQHPEKFIGIHFFSPVDKMPLVELICGEQTDDATVAKAFDFVKQIRKTPIVVNDKVGFFTSRTFSQQLMEAAQMVAEGVHPVRIDHLGKAIGMPVGPLTVHDEVSQKLTESVIKTQIEMGLVAESELDMKAGRALIKHMVNDINRQGRYHGDGGYYDYQGHNKTINQKLMDEYYNPEFDISDQDIKDRLLFINVIETLKCLEEKVVTTVADANIGSIMGIGAPTWTGGYVQFVNAYGVANFIQRCDELAKQYGDRFKAPEIAHKALRQPELFY